jgi:hypothetical protein
MAMWHGHITTSETLIARQLPTGGINSNSSEHSLQKADLFKTGQRCPRMNTISAIISIQMDCRHASVAIETMLGLTIELLRISRVFSR